MTESHSLLRAPDPEDTATPAADAPGADATPPQDAGAPDYLPAKFWDAEEGQVRVEDLARSYAALERRLGAAGGDTVPDDPGAYRIEPAMEGLTPDPEVNARLMEAGFTQAQAQLVYDLAAEKLAPLVQDLAAETVAGEQRRRLAEYFGGDERWQTTARQIETWGRAHLPAPVLQALGNSYDGVLTLHRMMQDGEPQLVSGGQSAPAGSGEAQLRRMMQDPRYWRDHDPAVAAEVRRGFEDLYPDEG